LENRLPLLGLRRQLQPKLSREVRRVRDSQRGVLQSVDRGQGLKGDLSMKSIIPLHLTFAIYALTMGTALAQHEQEPAAHRVGDPYPFADCPISAQKLGSMGDPVIKAYEGREVRFCCSACPKKFEIDKAGNLAKLDQRIIKDQGPLYPLKTSVVTAKALPAKPFEFVFGNRLVRLGAEAEKAEFLKNPKKYLGELDKATIAEQGKRYSLAKCPVSGDQYGGDMKPEDVVLAGRLIRLCCKDCTKDLEQNPAKFIAMVDSARKGDKDQGKSGNDHKDGGDHKAHQHQ
jgi:YHS domain-containing protein